MELPTHLAHLLLNGVLHTTTKNVAINDVLPHKATRRDAIANLKWFWGPGHQRPNFHDFIYIHYAVPP